MSALNAGLEQRIHERTDALGKLNVELQGNVGKRTEELLAANQEWRHSRILSPMI